MRMWKRRVHEVFLGVHMRAEPVGTRRDPRPQLPLEIGGDKAVLGQRTARDMAAVPAVRIAARRGPPYRYRAPRAQPVKGLTPTQPTASGRLQSVHRRTAVCELGERATRRSGCGCTRPRVASQSWFGGGPLVTRRRGSGPASPQPWGPRQQGCWPRQSVPGASALVRSSSALRGWRRESSEYQPIPIQLRRSWSAASAHATSSQDVRCCTRRSAASTTGRGSGCVPRRTWPTASAARCRFGRARDARSKHAQHVWRWCSARSR
jgi:hypothetical protein